MSGSGPAEEEQQDEVSNDWSRDEWWRRFQMYEDNFS